MASCGNETSVFVPPVSGILYQPPAQNALARAQEGNSKRIFSDIRVADLIDRAKSLPPRTKEVDVERLIAEARRDSAKKSSAPFPNLFSMEEREIRAAARKLPKSMLGKVEGKQI